ASWTGQSNTACGPRLRPLHPSRRRRGCLRDTIILWRYAKHLDPSPCPRPEAEAPKPGRDRRHVPCTVYDRAVNGLLAGSVIPVELLKILYNAIVPPADDQIREGRFVGPVLLSAASEEAIDDRLSTKRRWECN